MKELVRRLSLPIVQLILTLLMLMISVGMLNPSLMQRVELQLDDLRMRLFIGQPIDERIVIVDIDERSLQQLGQWPWSRQTLAELLRRLGDDYQVAVVGLDFVLAESERQDIGLIEQLLERGWISSHVPLSRLYSLTTADAELASVIRDYPVVPGFIFKRDSSLNLNQLPPPIAFPADSSTTALELHDARGFSGNIQPISQAADNQGFFDNPAVDSDGLYRRAVLIQRYQDQLYPALSLAVVQRLLSAEREQLLPIMLNVETQAGRQVVDHIQIGRLLIPLGEKGTARIPFHQRERGFRYVSAADVYAKRLAADELAGKVVLIGTSAPGLKDIRPTAVNSQLAGVEIHANLIRGLLDQSLPYQPEWRIAVEVLQLILISIILALLYNSRRPLLEILGTLLLAAIVVLVNLLLWQRGLLLSLAPALAQIALLYLLTSSWQLLTEYRGRQQVLRLFGQYVPPNLISRIQRQTAAQLLRGEERELTVLFSDVQGFTSISEQIAPEQLTQLMNRLLTPLTRVIYQQQGTIDKYMGDAIMAFWGAPLPVENHAAQAVQAALMLQQEIGIMSTSLADITSAPLAIGIGINTGQMSVGNMGSSYRMAYTVMGDSVNLGARLEALTRQYGVDILVSEFTAEAAPDFLYLPVDQVRVKGKQEPVRIYQPLAAAVQKPEALIELAGKAFTAYQKQQWQVAEDVYRSIATEWPELKVFCEVFLDRIAQLKDGPLTSDWDGVYQFKTK